MNMYRKLFMLVITFAAMISSASAADIIYPLKEISKPSCRFQDFSDLSSACIQNLPVLKTKDYEKLKDDYDYRRIYTVLWWATYDYAWDIGNWSHLWTDIATSKWTPVYTITDGEVIHAWNKTGRGKVVVVKHNVNGRTIHSNYAHLSKVSVKAWDRISTWDQVWEVGSTWNSTWNHLHFQIDINQDARNHPYYYWQNCSWTSSWSIVNQWLCRPDLIENTVDPLLFLETSWAIIQSSGSTWSDGKDQIVKEEVKKEAENKVISQDNLISQKEIQEREIRDFLKAYKITFRYSQLWNNVPLWDYETLKFSIVEKRTGKPFKWTLPDFMNFVADKSKVKIFPDRIRVTDWGSRDIQILWLKVWKTTLYVRIWDIIIYKKSLNIYDPKIKPVVETALINTNSWIYLGSEKKWLMVMRDAKKTNLISLPYSWNFVISVKNWLLCPFNAKAKSLSQEMRRKCSLMSYKKEIAYNYDSTFNWIPIFWVKADSMSPVKISLYSADKKEIIATKTIKTYTPKNLDKRDTYYEAAITTLKNSITDINSWYFLEDRVISERDAMSWVRNLLIYKRENAKTNLEKQKYSSKLVEASKFRWSLSKKMTRLWMLNLIWKYVPWEYRLDWIYYRDLTSEQNITANLIFNTKYTWKDRFWDKYFQPKKELTRWEAAYMLRQFVR